MYTLADYKVGDTVRIVYERPHDWNERPSWISDMDRLTGMLGTVIDIDRFIHVRVINGSSCSWDYKPTWLVPMKELEGGDLPKTTIAKTFYAYLQSKKVV